jgi:hypothetical protein
MIVKVPGVAYDFNGRRLILAPLTMGPLRQLLGRLKNFGQSMGEEQIDTAVDAVHASLLRNYPDITREQVENELLDAGNMYEVVPLVSNQSGLKRTSDDGQEQMTLGEAMTAQTVGSPSTPT